MKAARPLLLALLFSPLFCANSADDDQVRRIRRRIHLNPLALQQQKKKFLLESSENGINANNDGEGNEERQKFILKCPHTTKNISSVIWSHNGRAVFSVDIGPDGQLEAGKMADPSWLVEQRVWRSLDNQFGLILSAKRGRYRVEVGAKDDGPRGGRWIVLRIAHVEPEEDGGEWKCQLYGKVGERKLRLEAESRKRIEERSIRKTREFGEMPVLKGQKQQANRQWELWESLLEGRTFGFAKNEGELAIFERLDSTGGPIRIGDAVEYTRNDPIGGGGGELFGLENSSWRWRRARSSARRPFTVGISQLLLLPWAIGISLGFLSITPFAQKPFYLIIL